MRKVMMMAAVVLGTFVSVNASAGTLVCDVYGQNTVQITQTPQGAVVVELIQNLTQKTVLKGLASTVEQVGNETVISVNPWNYEFRIVGLGKKSSYYEGTWNRHLPIANDTILEMVCASK